MPKKKKRKIIIICVIVLFVLLIIGRVFQLFMQSQEPRDITSVNDFNDIREIVEFNGCTYIRMTSSSEDGYEEDIYIEFGQDPIEEDGSTNEAQYDNLTSQIGGKIRGTNFRIIDESRNIIIRLQFENNEVSLYTINNDPSYFEHLKTEYQVSKFQEDPQTNIQISSNVLNAIVNNNWSASNLNLGSMDSTCGGYDIYFDEGYKIRNIYSRVFNIIFTPNYQNEVFPGVRTGMTDDEVQSILGNATFVGEESGIIGYKNQQFYVFFNDGEISIYRNDNDYDTAELASLIEEYNNSGDYNKFVNDVTNMWQDYDAYTKTSDRVSIQYTLKGITINFNVINNNGITVYKNCKGQLANQIKNGEILANVYTNFDTDLVFANENNRVIGDAMSRNPVDPKLELNTDKYVVLYEETTTGGIENVKFISTDKTNPDIELKDIYINNIFKLDDNNYIYSIKGRGIYRINVETRQYQTIITGNENFDITSVTNNVIYYDGTQIEVR